MGSFYLDHNVSRDILRELRHLGHNVLSAADLGLEPVGDEEHLLVASERNMVLVTYNVKDFELLHDAWHRWSSAWQAQVQHWGILIIPATPIWLPQIAAAHLHELAEQRRPLPGQLLRWRVAEGWVLRSR